MRKILALVEGQTEERFVKTVLDPHFQRLGWYIIPRLLVTKYVKNGANFKGGITSFHQVSGDLRRLLNDSSAEKITTMLDFYGLPGDFPGYSSLGTFRTRVDAVLNAWSAHVGDRRFVPYLSTYEYEALIYRYPNLIARNCGLVSAPTICSSWDSHPDPESINNANPPGKIIQSTFERFIKRLHGPQVALDAGLEDIRTHCPFFNQWLHQLAA